MEIALKASSLRLTLRRNGDLLNGGHYDDHIIESSNLKYIGDDWIEISDEAIFGNPDSSSKHSSSRNKTYVNCIIHIHRSFSNRGLPDKNYQNIMRYTKIPLRPIRGPIIDLSIYLSYSEFDYLLDLLKNNLFPKFFLFSVEPFYENEISEGEFSFTYFHQSNMFGPYEWDTHKSEKLKVNNF